MPLNSAQFGLLFLIRHSEISWFFLRFLLSLSYTMAASPDPTNPQLSNRDPFDCSDQRIAQLQDQLELALSKPELYGTSAAIATLLAEASRRRSMSSASQLDIQREKVSAKHDLDRVEHIRRANELTTRVETRMQALKVSKAAAADILLKAAKLRAFGPSVRVED